MSDIKKVLVVEDEAALRLALVDKLTRAGFEVFEAKDGKSGLEMSLTKKPDIILLDLMMPGMDGLTMVDELNKLDGYNKIPLIVLTNSSGTDTIIDVIGRGINEYLVKSDWSINDIVLKVKNKLNI